MKPTLVLLSGLAFDEAMWRHQRAALADQTRIVVPDLTRETTIPALAESVLAAVPAGPFALAGFSMGGYVAFEVHRRAPERVARLALLDTSPARDTPRQARARRSFVDLVRRGRFEALARHLVISLVHPTRLGDRELGREVREMARRVGPDAYLRQQAAITARADATALLPSIRCPTLVLAGHQDVRTPFAVHEAMASAIPGATLVGVDVCGHFAPLERPEAVNAALRAWLGAI